LNDKKPKCPLCREEIVIPEGGIDQLPVNPFCSSHNNGKSISDNNNNNNNVDTLTCCELCDDNEIPAIVRCLQCDQLFCHGCQAAHQKLRLTMNHRFINLIDEDQDRTIKKTRLRFCREHHLERDTFCKQCDVPICLKCAVVYHSGHQVALIQDHPLDIEAIFTTPKEKVFFFFKR